MFGELGKGSPRMGTMGLWEWMKEMGWSLADDQQMCAGTKLLSSERSNWNYLRKRRCGKQTQPWEIPPFWWYLQGKIWVFHVDLLVYQRIYILPLNSNTRGPFVLFFLDVPKCRAPGLREILRDQGSTKSWKGWKAKDWRSQRGAQRYQECKAQVADSRMCGGKDVADKWGWQFLRKNLFEDFWVYHFDSEVLDSEKNAEGVDSKNIHSEQTPAILSYHIKCLQYDDMTFVSRCGIAHSHVILSGMT